MRKLFPPLVALLLAMSLFLFPFSAFGASTTYPLSRLDFSFNDSEYGSYPWNDPHFKYGITSDIVYENRTYAHYNAYVTKVSTTDPIGTSNLTFLWQGRISNLSPLTEYSVSIPFGAIIGSRTKTKSIRVIMTANSMIRSGSLTLTDGVRSYSVVQAVVTPESDYIDLSFQIVFQAVQATGSLTSAICQCFVSDPIFSVNVSGDGANWGSSVPDIPSDGSDEILNDVSSGVDNIDSLLSQSNSFVSSLTATFSFISSTINRFWADADLSGVIVLVLALGLGFYVIGKRVSSS